MNIICSIILSAAVSADPVSHSVTFTARATGITRPSPLEFMFVGPGSDHDYESMFVTDADVAEIANAFDTAGISRGIPFDESKARFWPVGDFVEMEPKFDTLVRECFGESLRPMAYTGGTRNPDGSPVAATNMPLAVFALYNMPQSLLQFDESLDQSATYTRFKPAVQLKEGERMEFKFVLRKKGANTPFKAIFSPGSLPDAVKSMRKASEKSELDVMAYFSPDLTLGESRKIAAALSMLDSPSIKLNGFYKGQFFYQSFLPKESWKDRKERLCQPPEVRFLEDGKLSVTQIKESWSKDDNNFEPQLSATETIYDSIEEAAAAADTLGRYTSTILIYAPDNTILSKLYEFKSHVKGDIRNYYFM